MATLAEMLGGCLAMAILASICGFFFKLKQPDDRALYATAIAFILAYILAGFGNADGGPFVWSAGIIYIPGAILAYFLLKRRYEKRADEMEATDG